MSDAAAKNSREANAQVGVPVGRILSAADYAKLCAVDRGLDAKRIRHLPSLHEQARAHGYESGMRRAIADLGATLLELQRYRADRDAWLQSLLFAILRKMLGEEQGVSLIPAIVERAIEECDRELGAISVHIHTAAAAAVAKSLGAMSGKTENKGLRVDVVPQERLSATTCEIHTPFGIIDASVDTQLDALLRALRADDSVASHDSP